jgi:hypothetical protein
MIDERIAVSASPSIETPSSGRTRKRYRIRAS